LEPTDVSNSRARTALITGVTGQDGAYLARQLLAKGYRVIGGVRRSSTPNFARLAEFGIADDIEFVDFELMDATNYRSLLEKATPDELYNLASQSYVGASFAQPVYTGDCDGLGVTRLLEAIRGVNPAIRFYQASTSELFARASETPQSETTPFHPLNPYGVAKLYAHWITINYRESYRLHTSCGILFNHESPLRRREFVTRKITFSLAQVKHGHLDLVEMGNLDARRDWGFAGDFMDAVWRMVQQPHGDDFVVATGVTRSVRDFVLLAGQCLGFDLAFEGRGSDERAVDRRNGRVIVRVNPALFRPAEIDVPTGNAAKAAKLLGWRSTMPFADLVASMAEADDRRVRDGVSPF
jgi:GDPmannose 4,6-dehydratase